MLNTVKHCLATAALVGASLGAGTPDTRVVDAAERRDVQAISVLVKQGVDVNAAQGDGGTALHWAAHWNDVAMARRLLQAGARVDAVNDYGVTPLFLAASNGSPEMAGLLLDAGARATAALPTGETVLMTAVTGGNTAVVKQLLAKGANPNVAQTSKGQTPLMWAALGQNIDIVKALIEGGADVKARSKAGFAPVHFAAREGNIDAVRAFLAAKVDVDDPASDNTNPLVIATVRGHVDLALFLLEQGANPEGNPSLGYTPLHWATGEYDVGAVTYTEITAPGEWGAITGIPDRQKKFALIKALLARGADINAVASRPLPQMSPLNGSTIQPHSGLTPFLNAAASADAEMMRFLVANGANPHVRARDGYNGIMAASEGSIENSPRLNEDRRTEAIRLAHALGNDIEAADRRGWRAMHVAAFGGFNKVIKQLVDLGADLNSKTNPQSQAAGGLGNVALEPQTPRGLAEGTLSGIFQERPATAAFLASLGARSEGAFNQNAYEENERKSNSKNRPKQ